MDSVGLKERVYGVRRESDEDRGRIGEEERGAAFDQNTLCACVKLSNNGRLKRWKNAWRKSRKEGRGSELGESKELKEKPREPTFSKL